MPGDRWAPLALLGRGGLGPLGPRHEAAPGGRDGWLVVGGQCRFQVVLDAPVPDGVTGTGAGAGVGVGVGVVCAVVDGGGLGVRAGEDGFGLGLGLGLGFGVDWCRLGVGPGKDGFGFRVRFGFDRCGLGVRAGEDGLDLGLSDRQRGPGGQRDDVLEGGPCVPAPVPGPVRAGAEEWLRPGPDQEP